MPIALLSAPAAVAQTATLAGALAAVTVDGRTHALTAGVIDDAAVAVFTAGHCHRLALALHERTGWPLRVVVEDTAGWPSLADDVRVRRDADAGRPIPFEYLNELWLHVAVARPDGLLVDVHGARTADTVLTYYDGIDDADAGTVDVDGYAMQRSRLVPASAAEVAALESTAATVPGVADPFVDAVLALPPAPAVAWGWQQTLAAHVTDGLARAAADADAAGEAFAVHATDFLTELDVDYGLLADAANRGLLPPEVTDLAAAVLTGH